MGKTRSMSSTWVMRMGTCLDTYHFTHPLGIDMLQMSHAAIQTQISFNLFSTSLTRHVKPALRHANHNADTHP